MLQKKKKILQFAISISMLNAIVKLDLQAFHVLHKNPKFIQIYISK